jgi:hypothetical protein
VLPRRLSVAVFVVLVGYTLAACDDAPTRATAPAADQSLSAQVVDARRASLSTSVFDGDSVINIGQAYDVSQHFYFVVRGSTVPVTRIVSLAFVQTEGSPVSPGAEVCTVPPRGTLVLFCPATNIPGSYSGYWLVTVRAHHARGSFHLYTLTVPNSPLSLTSSFDGDSIIREGHPYDAAKHFFFPVLENGDSVTSDAVVNLPSVQWMLAAGTAPDPAPSCSPALDVLVLDCPASSGTGFTGYYVVSVQEASFNGIANPTFRGAFDLYVNPKS